jgi:hypothetical protein
MCSRSRGAKAALPTRGTRTEKEIPMLQNRAAACAMVAACGLAVPASAAVGPITIPIDQAQSSVNVRLCLIGSCANDTSPVTGNFVVSLNARSAPSQISLSNFNLSLTESLTLNISFGFLGRFNSTVNGLRVRYATPGTVLGPVAITNDAFTFANVPTLQEGTLVYTSTGIVCSALQNAMRPCNDTINLADQGQTTTEAVGGTITVANGIVTLLGTINTTQPLDPANPDLGTITITGTIRGSAPLPPCRADYNGDQTADFFDYLDFVQDFATDAPRADFNGDNIIDFFDYLDFVQAFSEGCD